MASTTAQDLNIWLRWSFPSRPYPVENVFGTANVTELWHFAVSDSNSLNIHLLFPVQQHGTLSLSLSLFETEKEIQETAELSLVFASLFKIILTIRLLCHLQTSVEGVD